MSKKKRKNSNYHYNVETVQPEVQTLSKKTILTIAIAAVLVIGLIAGIVACNLIENKPLYAEMKFEGFEGSVIVELYPGEAPITVKNFVDLVEDGFYDGLTIF